MKASFQVFYINQKELLKKKFDKTRYIIHIETDKRQDG